jgi:hypothetical protein
VSLQDEEGPGNAGAADDGTPAGSGSIANRLEKSKTFLFGWLCRHTAKSRVIVAL